MRFQRFPGLQTAVFYEVNLRQYSLEGTINAFIPQLSRLKDMGVTVLWFMPIHPIGKVKRKGTLGSYYSINDYRDVNPEFGTKEDFHNLIQSAHALGLQIVIDWVANHAAWDNVWTKTNPEFFERDDQGNFKAPYDWDDVIQIDHHSQDQKNAMIAAMHYWVSEFKIDGFRADLAHLTPLSFWIQARTELSEYKPGLIWLAETENIEYYEAFDITYAWKWMHAIEEMLKDKKPASKLRDFLLSHKQALPMNALQLYFTSNHDENSWNGTEYEKYGLHAKALAVFSYTYENSIPLIYTGQEIPNRRRLKFFDKDHLEWGSQPELHIFYRRLETLRGKIANAVFQFLNANDDVFCFSRTTADVTLIVCLNLGHTNNSFLLPLPGIEGYFTNFFEDTVVEIRHSIQISLEPGGYLCMLKE